MNLSFSDQMMNGQYLFDNQDYLDWVVGLTTRDTFQNTVDAISGYHTMTGQWPDYSKIQEILSSYSAVPNNGSDGTLDQDGDGFSSRQEIVFRTSDSDPTDFPSSAFNVGAFIDDTLSSREYTNIHGPVPVLTPPQSGPDRFTNYDKNRRDFVQKIFSNKYGRLPTLQQEIQGSYRISVFDQFRRSLEMGRQRQMMPNRTFMFFKFWSRWFRWRWRKRRRRKQFESISSAFGRRKQQSRHSLLIRVGSQLYCLFQI